MKLAVKRIKKTMKHVTNRLTTPSQRLLLALPLASFSPGKETPSSIDSLSIKDFHKGAATCSYQLWIPLDSGHFAACSACQAARWHHSRSVTHPGRTLRSPWKRWPLQVLPAGPSAVLFLADRRVLDLGPRPPYSLKTLYIWHNIIYLYVIYICYLYVLYACYPSVICMLSYLSDSITLYLLPPHHYTICIFSAARPYRSPHRIKMLFRNYGRCRQLMRNAKARDSVSRWETKHQVLLECLFVYAALWIFKKTDLVPMGQDS